jgi:hypothetical protein
MRFSSETGILLRRFDSRLNGLDESGVRSTNDLETFGRGRGRVGRPDNNRALVSNWEPQVKLAAAGYRIDHRSIGRQQLRAALAKRKFAS